VSIYSQIIPRKDTSGSEASIAPITELLFDISETATIIIAEIVVFKIR